MMKTYERPTVSSLGISDMLAGLGPARATGYDTGGGHSGGHDDSGGHGDNWWD
jgi:hypothetical protein